LEAKLSSKGQATIPKAVRERLSLKPGDRFKFFFHPDGVIILPKIPTSRLKGAGLLISIDPSSSRWSDSSSVS